MAFAFGIATTLDPFISLICILAVIFFIIVFEFFTGLLEHYVEGSVVYNRMIQKIYKELMQVGVVSFLIVMSNAGKSHPPKDWFTGIDIAHILIFFVAIFYVIHAFFLMGASAYASRRYMYLHCCSAYKMLEDAYQLDNIRNVYFNNFVVPISKLRNEMEFKMYSDIFRDTYPRLPKDFNYPLYLSKCYNRFVLKTIEIGFTTWIFVMLLVIANYMRIIFHGSFNCGHESVSTLHRRSLAESSGGEGGGEGGGHAGFSSFAHDDSCYKQQLRLFILCGAGVCAYMLILFFVSRLYELRLLACTGVNPIKKSSFLEYFLFTTNELKLKSQSDFLGNHDDDERMESADLIKLIVDSIDDENEFNENKEFYSKLVSKIRTLSLAIKKMVRLFQSLVRQLFFFVCCRRTSRELTRKIFNASDEAREQSSPVKAAETAGNLQALAKRLSVHSAPIRRGTKHITMAGQSPSIELTQKVVLPLSKLGSDGEINCSASTTTSLIPPSQTDQGISCSNSIANDFKTLTTTATNAATTTTATNASTTAATTSTTATNAATTATTAAAAATTTTTTAAAAAAAATTTTTTISDSYINNIKATDLASILPEEDVPPMTTMPLSAVQTPQGGLRKTATSPTAKHRKISFSSDVLPASSAPGEPSMTKVDALRQGSPSPLPSSLLSGETLQTSISAQPPVESSPPRLSHSGGILSKGSATSILPSQIVVDAAPRKSQMRRASALRIGNEHEEDADLTLVEKYRKYKFERRIVKEAAVSCWSTLLCCSISRGNRIQPKEDTQSYMLSDDFSNIFIGKDSYYYFKAIEIGIMVNCLYMTVWGTSFISIVNEFIKLTILMQIIMTIPILLSLISIAYVAQVATVIVAITQLQLDLVKEVLEESEDVSSMLLELREAILEKIIACGGNVSDKEELKSLIFQMFDEMNVDTGRTDMDRFEFRLFLKRLKLFYSDERFIVLFRSIVRDGSSRLSREAMAHMMLTRGSSMRERARTESLKRLSVKIQRARSQSGEAEMKTSVKGDANC